MSWHQAITVRTAEKEHIYDGALSDLEQKYAHLFVRVHRNALVARRCVRAVEKHNDPIDGEGWTVRLDGVDERLSVSRRQLAAAGSGPPGDRSPSLRGHRRWACLAWRLPAASGRPGCGA